MACALRFRSIAFSFDLLLCLAFRHQAIPRGILEDHQSASDSWSFLSTGQSSKLETISAGTHLRNASGCRPKPFLSPYLKPRYKVSIALSAGLLDKVLQQEARAFLEGMGFQYVTVEPGAACKLKQVSPSDIIVQITRVSLHYNNVDLGKNVALFFTLQLKADGIYFKDARISSNFEHDTLNSIPADFGGMAGIKYGWRDKIRKWSAPVVDKAVNMAVKTALSQMRLNTFQRNFCLANAGGRFTLRISKLIVDDKGDLGIGLTFQESGCPGEWEDDQAPMLNLSQNHNLLFQVGENVEESYVDPSDLPFLTPETALPPSERSRFAMYFEDGFVEKMFADQALGVAVDGTLKAHAANTDINPLAGLFDNFAPTLNLLLASFGVARHPSLSDVRWRFYRLPFWRDSSFILIDITNKGIPILDSVFGEMEKHTLFGGLKGEQINMERKEVGELERVSTATVVLGECA